MRLKRLLHQPFGDLRRVERVIVLQQLQPQRHRAAGKREDQPLVDERLHAAGECNDIPPVRRQEDIEQLGDHAPGILGVRR